MLMDCDDFLQFSLSLSLSLIVCLFEEFPVGRIDYFYDFVRSEIKTKPKINFFSFLRRCAICRKVESPGCFVFLYPLCRCVCKQCCCDEGRNDVRLLLQENSEKFFYLRVNFPFGWQTIHTKENSALLDGEQTTTVFFVYRYSPR